jgi:hypothetical protein
VTDFEVLQTSGDATLRGYTRTGDELRIELTLWDEQVRVLVAHGVTTLADDGSWEAEALVRFPPLDDGPKKGYAIIDVEDNPTLRFAADGVETA